MRVGNTIGSRLLAALLLLAPVAGHAQDAAAGQATVKDRIAVLAAAAAQDRQAFAARPLRAQSLLVRFYDGTGNLPVWSNGGLEQARQALALLRDADAHGLRPADYQVSQPLPDIGAATPEQLARFDIALSTAMLQLLTDLHGGRVAPDFVSFLDQAEAGAFDPATQLRQALRQGRLHDVLAGAEPRIALYARVRETLAQYRELARRGPDRAALPVLPSGAPLRRGMPWAGAAPLRERLELLGDLAPDTAPDAAPGVYGPSLEAGIRRFQLRHGLQEDGILGASTMAALAVPLSHRVRQLELTLERLRWLPPLRPGPLIVVNLPLFRLWAFNTRADPAELPLEMRVIVGSAARTPTPLFIGQLRHLEFNPYWNVPRSIERGEILPKLARDPRYLRDNDMEIVAGNGKLLGGGAALAALRAGSARLRQRPGARNVLGAVKFAMPNPMNIYLHSTSARELFDRPRRDLSHGCIRVDKPAELAEFVLRGDARWDRERVRAAMAPGPNRTVRLPAPVPVILAYTTAVTDRDGRALFADDIYGRDRKLARSLGLPEPAAVTDGLSRDRER